MVVQKIRFRNIIWNVRVIWFCCEPRTLSPLTITEHIETIEIWNLLSSSWFFLNQMKDNYLLWRKYKVVWLFSVALYELKVSSMKYSRQWQDLRQYRCNLMVNFLSQLCNKTALQQSVNGKMEVALSIDITARLETSLFFFFLFWFEWYRTKESSFAYNMSFLHVPYTQSFSACVDINVDSIIVRLLVSRKWLWCIITN